MKISFACFALATIIFFSGCTSLPFFSDQNKIADQLVFGSDFEKIQIKTNPFLLTGYSRIAGKSSPLLRLYIEGDGYAWITPTRPSGNPTPYNPVGLKLALADSSSNVVYLARPCQYTKPELDPACNDFFWTAGWFSETVINSMNEAIDFLIKKYQAGKIELVGYSGGGAVALLLAVRRHDIVSVRTVAGNLNPEAVNQYHKVSTLKSSLNPLDFAPLIAALPQQHFTGSKDNIVPPFIAESYLKASGESKCVQIVPVENASHDSLWIDDWQKLLKTPFRCKT